MKKRWITVLLSLSLLLSGCVRFKRLAADIPASTPDPGPASPAETLLPAPTAPDFAAMTFVEKNNLYLQLLNDKLAQGANTIQAEELYALCLTAMLQGDSTGADQYLEQAILHLWNQ